MMLGLNWRGPFGLSLDMQVVTGEVQAVSASSETQDAPEPEPQVTTGETRTMPRRADGPRIGFTAPACDPWGW